MATVFRADIQYRLGRLTEARDDVDTALDQLDGLAIRRGFLPGLVDSTLPGLVVDLGDADATRALLRRFQEAALPPYFRTNFILHARGNLHAALDDPHAALA